QLPNSVDFVAAFIAALERKLVMVPIDRDATETEVGTILSHFAIKGLLYRRDRAAVLTTRTISERPAVPSEARLIKTTSGSTGAPLIPMVFGQLTTVAEGGFDSVRTFLSAGAPLPPSTSRRFRERFGREIHSFYGCSECGGITYDRRGAAVERGTVGSAMENVTLSIANERLVVRSDAVAVGYLHDAKTFAPFETFVADDLAEI